jgi:hypothetical protein
MPRASREPSREPSRPKELTLGCHELCKFSLKNWRTADGQASECAALRVRFHSLQNHGRAGPRPNAAERADAGCGHSVSFRLKTGALSMGQASEYAALRAGFTHLE